MSTTTQADLIDVQKLVTVVGNNLVIANDEKERQVQEFAVAQTVLAAAEARMKIAAKAVGVDRLKESISGMGMSVLYDSSTVLLMASAKAAPRQLSVDRLRNALMRAAMPEPQMEAVIEASKGPAGNLAVSLTATLKGP